MKYYLEKTFCQWRIFIILYGVGVCLLASEAAFAGFIQLDGVADVKTRFSRGCSTLQEVTELARARNIDIVIFGDQSRDTLEYGLYPFERIIRKRYENSSILTVGAPAYISEINDNNKQFKETLLLPGAEVAPFYYWTEKGKLVANNPDKHLFVVGFDKPELYEQLPILDSNFSNRYLAEYQNFFGIYAALFFVFIVPFVKGYKRKTTGFLAIIMFFLLANNHPFRSSPFNQYSGDQGVKPYQELIDYVNDNGGLIFWNHMEATDGIKEEGQVGFVTKPYPEDLILTSDYTGFQSVGYFPIQQTEPGNEWDQVLGEYLKGKREKPIWGYGGNNYLCEDGEAKLGDIRTIFLVRQKSKNAVLDALVRGSMYAVRQSGDERLSLDDFTVSDITTGRKATMGEELESSDFPELKIKVRATKGSEQTVSLSVIRNGSEIKQETVSLPYEMVWRDVDVKREQGPVFYRLKVKGNSTNYLVSNPIFVHFKKGTIEQVASVSNMTTGEASLIKAEKPKVNLPQIPIAPSVKLPHGSIQNKMAQIVPKPTPSILEEPNVSKVQIPSVPIPALKPQVIKKSVVAKINGVSLKNGPGPKFPEVGRLNKGDTLPLIRRTSVKFNGEPWLMVDADGRKVYVWSKLVATE